MKHSTSWAMALSLVLAFMTAGAARATVIDFTGLGLNLSIPAGYGSVPHVAVSWTNACSWNNDYGDLVYVAFAANSGNCDVTGPVASIKFQADAGFRVNLQSFDIAGYFFGGTYYGAGNHRVEVLDQSNTVVFDTGNVAYPQGSHSSFAPSLLSNDGGSLTLEFDAGPSPSYYVGIDNINFASNSVDAIPEPATLALLGLGLSGLGFSRRKQA